MGCPNPPYLFTPGTAGAALKELADAEFPVRGTIQIEWRAYERMIALADPDADARGFMYQNYFDVAMVKAACPEALQPFYGHTISNITTMRIEGIWADGQDPADLAVGTKEKPKRKAHACRGCGKLGHNKRNCPTPVAD